MGERDNTIERETDIIESEKEGEKEGGRKKERDKYGKKEITKMKR